jgi:hypothetical protein
MCLSHFANFNLPEVFTVWKVIRKDNGGAYYHPPGNKKYPHKFHVGMNVDTKETKIHSLCDGRYKTGFHCYLTRQAAREGIDYYEKIIKATVKRKDVVATGFQQGRKVVVCHKIKIENLKHQR